MLVKDPLNPEQYQTRKGNQWYVGMKAHIGVNADSGPVHTVVTAPTNAADVEVAGGLLHAMVAVVHADAGYTGVNKRVERRHLTWQIAAKRDCVKAMPDGQAKRTLKRRERAKASVRGTDEHLFRWTKRLFGPLKVSFGGLAKNTTHVITLFALASPWIVRRRLWATTGALRP